jgi:hypothetical protein
VIDYRTALLWILAGLIAGYIGFRDLNVTYLLLPMWTLTGYEWLRRGADLRPKGLEFLVVYLGIVTVLVLPSYTVGRLCSGLAS